MSNTIVKGDYVLATKYSDGDPLDHWVVGFYDSMLQKTTEDRFMVVDNDGNQFRGNGFRRAQKIEGKRGAWLLNNAKYIEQSGRSLWWWIRQPIDEF